MYNMLAFVCFKPMTFQPRSVVSTWEHDSRIGQPIDNVDRAHYGMKINQDMTFSVDVTTRT